MNLKASEAAILAEYEANGNKVTLALNASMMAMEPLPNGGALLDSRLRANVLAAIDDFTATRRRIYEINGWEWTEDESSKDAA